MISGFGLGFGIQPDGSVTLAVSSVGLNRRGVVYVTGYLATSVRLRLWSLAVTADTLASWQLPRYDTG